MPLLIFLLQTTHKCPICLDDVEGAKCLPLQGCGHIVCHNCLEAHCMSKIKDGEVTEAAMTCPTCPVTLSYGDMKGTLSTQDFER